ARGARSAGYFEVHHHRRVGGARAGEAEVAGDWPVLRGRRDRRGYAHRAGIIVENGVSMDLLLAKRRVDRIYDGEADGLVRFDNAVIDNGKRQRLRRLTRRKRQGAGRELEAAARSSAADVNIVNADGNGGRGGQGNTHPRRLAFNRA